MSTETDNLKSNELHSIKDVLDYQIFSVAKKSPLEYKELYQIAYLGYLKAQKNFNEDYGKISLKYASRYIRQELIAALRKEYKVMNHTDAGSEVEGCPDDNEENPTSNPIFKHVKEAIKLLPKEQAEIVTAFYLDYNPKRLVDLAREKGVSKQRIHQLKQKGLNRIKELLTEWDKI